MMTKNEAFQRDFQKKMGYRFHPETFDWSLGSNTLAATFHMWFSVWWDIERFKGNAAILMRHINHKFEVWWPYAKGDLTHYELIVFCSNHFEIWWPDICDSFVWDKKMFKYMETHCAKYQLQWMPDAIVHKLMSE